jgi:hypothetical protein
MKVAIGGCSFTSWPEYPDGPNICWPAHLNQIRPDLDIELLAEPAAGNQYICDSVIRSVLLSRPDHVLVMWSGVSRLDYLTSLEDPSWERLYDSYGFYRRVPPGNKLGYIFSGGHVGTWYANPTAANMFRQMYKVSSPLSLGYINLMEMIKLQNFLQNLNIPYHFMSYVNYWCHEPQVSRNGDFGVLAFPELKFLVDAIDFDKWIFDNDQRATIFDVAKRLDDFREDGFHPGDQANRYWAELVNQQLPTRD